MENNKTITAWETEESLKILLNEYLGKEDSFLKKVWENSIYKDNLDVYEGMKYACIMLPMLLNKSLLYIEGE